MSKRFPKSSLLGLGLSLVLSSAALAQHVPGDLTRSSMGQGAAPPARTTPSTTNNQSTGMTNVTQNNLQSDAQLRSATARARQDSNQCENRRGGRRSDANHYTGYSNTSGYSNGSGFTYYQGAPTYPGPNAALPTPGTYFYQSPYYGYGYGPNGYGYGYNPYGGNYYTNGYQRGYQR